VRIGLALPQYDFSVPGESPLTWETLRGVARRADAAGFDSLWLSDHLFFDIGKYGGSSARSGAYEPIVTLGALAREVKRARLGTLVLCEALRPATVLAKALASLDRITGGRLDVGLGAGWYEPEYEAIGMAFPSPAVRLARLAEAVEIVTELLGPEGGPCTFDGEYHRADGAINLPPALQEPRPPVFVGGKGDRLIQLAVDKADGWNTCWVWTPAAYMQRLEVVERACERADRDPETVWRSVGLYALCGEDEADLVRRFERLRANTPPGVMDTMTLEQWRVGRLVGTVEEVREQAATWAALGVETLILGVGAVPFHLGAEDDVTLLAEALGVSGARASSD
jgi:alkanesulfonate monooxygenase SsuD/methylene tetrahydromethanopterin reductase-like flavin-dependent oxidoreductase (luciferase family)